MSFSFILSSFFATEEEQETPKKATKQQARTPSSSAKKQNATVPKKKAVAKVQQSVAGEVRSLGDWFFFSNGKEGYADNIVVMRVGRGEEHLNLPLDLAQFIPQVMFDRPLGKCKVLLVFMLLLCPSFH